MPERRRIRVKIVAPTRYRGRHLQLSAGRVRFESNVDYATPLQAQNARRQVQDALDQLTLGYRKR